MGQDDSPEALQRLREFDVFDALFNLLSELFFVFNWFEGTLLEEYQKSIQRALKGVSIFTGTMPTAEALAPRRKKKKAYKTREDFENDDKYGNYVKATLRQGMRVCLYGMETLETLPPSLLVSFLPPLPPGSGQGYLRVSVRGRLWCVPPDQQWPPTGPVCMGRSRRGHVLAVVAPGGDLASSQ